MKTRLSLVLCLTALLLPRLAAHAAETPNIVVILADDFGYGSLGCYGGNPALIKTPHLDRLAREGRRFTDGNTTSSVCSPTRYSLITGRYCWRTSLKHEVLSTFAPLHIETNRLNMASLLKQHGYATAAVGKWHLGYGTANERPNWRPDYAGELSPGPLDLGFDYHFGVPANHGDLTGVFVENRYVYGLRSGKIPPGMKIPGPVPDSDNFKATYEGEDTEGGRGAGRILDLDAPRRKNERVMAELTDKAATWMQRQPKDKPFFLYFTPVAVHNPITPDKDLAGKSAAGAYGDFIHELDRSVGRILDTLDKMGVANNTLVLFTSDNGGVFVTNRTDSPQTKAFNAGLTVNGALRGGKHTVWEGGFKVPFLVRWPGKVQAGSVCNEMVSIVDILATTAALVGHPLPAAGTAAEDSRSFLPALLGNAPGRTDMIVHSSDGVFALRKGPWKWIEGVPVDEVKPGARKVRAAEFRPQLIHTKDDPAETKDVSAAHPEVVKELSELLNRYRDGGYSRELPPPGAKPKTAAVSLASIAGKVVLSDSLAQLPSKPWTTRGTWEPKAGGLWGAQRKDDQQGATLHMPLAIGDGTIEYEIQFKGANRHSLRVEVGGKQGSFRIEVARNRLAITKNPSQGEAKDAVQPLTQKPLQLEAGQWYPVRITFKGEEVTAQVNDVIVKGSHAVVGKEKTGANLLVFGESAGFRNLKIVR
jgi:arylsulfatase A